MTFPRRCTLASLASSLLLVASLGACGSSSTSSGSTTSSTSTSVRTGPAPGTATTTSPAPTGAKHHRAGKPKLHATVYRPPTTGTKTGASGPGSAATPSASAQNPCTFVRQAEAQAIVHAQISREIEAPQGPTCLLELQGGKHSITLAVEAVKLPRVIAQMKKKPSQLDIGGHTAYCGTLGSSLLFVELGAGRALEVAAPCAPAAALAAKALPRIRL